jgi:serine/threonine protein kinase
MKEEFMYEGHLCIVFELLSSSLLELVGWTNSDEVQGLSLRMVHKFSHQLVCALATLRTLQVIHCDLKPENIALLHPNRAHIKVLDFGSACQPWENQVNVRILTILYCLCVSNVIDTQHFPYIQSRFYRAPEILLGTPYSFPIDMWSLGCVLVELYTARPLFPGRDSIEQLYKIMEVLGPPPNNMLEQAVYLKKYFVKKGNELFLKEVRVHNPVPPHSY